MALLLSRLRQSGPAFAAAGYVAFIAAFFVLGNGHWHKIIFYGALGLGALAWWRTPFWRELFVQRLFQVLVLYIGYQALSLLWSPVFSGEELGEVLRKSALVTAFVVLTASVIRHQRWERWLLTYTIEAAAIAAFVTLAFYYCSCFVNPETDRLWGFGLGRGDNPIQAAALYGVALIVTAYQGLRAEKIMARVVLTGCWLVLATTLIETESRGAFGAAVLAHLSLILQFLVLRYGWSVSRAYWMTAIGVMAMMVFLADALIDLDSWIHRADSFRLEIWEHALQLWKTQPLLGLGYRTPFELALSNGQVIYQPHSLYVAALYYGGVIGLVSLLGLIYAASRSLNITFRQSRDLSGVLYLALLLNAVVFFVVDYDLLLVNADTEWLLFWLPVGGALGYALRANGETHAHTT